MQDFQDEGFSPLQSHGYADAKLCSVFTHFTHCNSLMALFPTNWSHLTRWLGWLVVWLVVVYHLQQCLERLVLTWAMMIPYCPHSQHHLLHQHQSIHLFLSPIPLLAPLHLDSPNINIPHFVMVIPCLSNPALMWHQVISVSISNTGALALYTLSVKMDRMNNTFMNSFLDDAKAHVCPDHSPQ